MAVGGDKQHRHIRAHEQGDQQRKGDRGQDTLRHGGRTDGCEQVGLVALKANEGQDKLKQRKGRGEPERGETGFGDHAACPLIMGVPS